MNQAIGMGESWVNSGLEYVFLILSTGLRMIFDIGNVNIVSMYPALIMGYWAILSPEEILHQLKMANMI